MAAERLSRCRSWQRHCLAYCNFVCVHACTLRSSFIHTRKLNPALSTQHRCYEHGNLGKIKKCSVNGNISAVEKKRGRVARLEVNLSTLIVVSFSSLLELWHFYVCYGTPCACDEPIAWLVSTPVASKENFDISFIPNVFLSIYVGI